MVAFLLLSIESLPLPFSNNSAMVAELGERGAKIVLFRRIVVGQLEGAQGTTVNLLGRVSVPELYYYYYSEYVTPLQL